MGAAVAALVFAHLHNGVALVLWWCWRRDTSRVRLLPLLAFLGGAAAILAGVLDLPALTGAEASRLPDSLGFAAHVADLAPSLPGAWGLRAVLLFAFAQSVHYGVWLRLVPDEDRSRPSPRTFAASWRALEADFGRTPLLFTAAIALAVAAWAALDLAAARQGYLRMAVFHGHLELAALALIAIEGTPRVAEDPA